jgi:hypothetical protein
MAAIDPWPPGRSLPTRCESDRFAEVIASVVHMNTLPETHEVEVIKRFLFRFADLMSTGSNADNLLRAAQLLEANVNRANDAEQQLLIERLKCASLEAQLAALTRDDHAYVPVSILRLAATQFESLAAEFEKSGNVVSRVMCSASASTLERAFEGKASRSGTSAFLPVQAGRQATV